MALQSNTIHRSKYPIFWSYDVTWRPKIKVEISQFFLKSKTSCLVQFVPNCSSGHRSFLCYIFYNSFFFFCMGFMDVLKRFWSTSRCVFVLLPFSAQLFSLSPLCRRLLLFYTDTTTRLPFLWPFFLISPNTQHIAQCARLPFRLCLGRLAVYGS
jgi:hypothetical protein